MSGGKGGSAIVGYNYYFGIHMGISRGPVDELVQINVADRQAWPQGTPDPNEPPRPVETSREYPQDIEFSTPYLDPTPVVGEDYHVDIYVEVPEDFKYSPDGNVTITNLIRGGVSLDGIYPIVFIGAKMVGEVSGEGGSPGVYTLLITINLGINPVLIDKWQTAALVAGDPADGPVVMSILDGGDGGIYSETATESCRIFIDAAGLFGGEKNEGGIEGPMDVMMGEATQVAPTGLDDMLGAPLPGYRGVFTAFFDGLISSLNPYPKPWKFRVRRALKGWDGEVWQPALAIITMTRPMASGEAPASTDIKAMNPAHIVYECLTNRVWGRGLPRTMIDEAAFLAAATTLYDEGFGLCLRWSRRDSIESFVQSVLDHIGAALYTNRTTAKLALKLIRAVADPSTLPLFDPDNGLKDVREAGVGSAGNYVNEVKVTYRDPLTDEDRTVKVDNLASLQANNGAFHSVSRNFPGIPTPALALRVAQRELRSVGVELRRFTLVLDRRAWDLTPGDPIRIRDPIRGIKEMVVRIGRFEDGTITDGKIVVSAVQDMFALPAASYVGNQTGVSPPTLDPCVGEFQVFELPYGLLAGNTSAADFATIEPEFCYLGVTMEQGRQTNTAYAIATRAGAPEVEDLPADSGAFCGYLQLEFALAVGDVDLETEWSANWQEVESEFVVNYNAVNDGGWVVDAPAYTSLDELDLPLEVRLRKELVTQVEELKWRWSGVSESDTANHFDTLNEAIEDHYEHIQQNTFLVDGSTIRPTTGYGSNVESDEPYVTGLTRRRAYVEITYSSEYGYPGDTTPPGWYGNTTNEIFYQFWTGNMIDVASTAYSDVYPYERRRV